MDKIDKKRLIEERQKKWASEKESESVAKECRDEMRGDDDDNYLSRLTDKLSIRIRDEIKRELRNTSLLQSNENIARQVIEVKMENYLRGELSSYVCKICYEIMSSPLRIPILLFPCGHTFCKQCIDSCTKKVVSSSDTHTSQFSCPYCR
jgi:RING-type zinc-finger